MDTLVLFENHDPLRAGYFSTLRLLASLQRQNSRFYAQTVAFAGAALRGRVSRKISNARCRDLIFNRLR
jgi:hypothetical protein